MRASVTLNVGQSTNFRIMVVASNDVISGYGVNFNLLAETVGNSYSYFGDDGIEYGGNIGKDWLGVLRSWAFGDIYHQNSVLSNGFISLVISSTTVMKIGKSIVSGTSQPGEYIRYKLFYTNMGNSTAAEVKITDYIPAGTIYSQGSMFWEANSITNTLTDGASYTNSEWDPSEGEWVDVPYGDDEGYYDSSLNEVIFTPNGFSPTEPGNLLPGAAGSFYFTVYIQTNNPPINLINTAFIQGINFSNVYTNLITPLVALSNATLSITKSISNIMLRGSRGGALLLCGATHNNNYV